MSDEWLTSEPEVGQVAWLKNDPPFGPVICFISDRGKAWKFAHGAKCLCDPSCPPWLPITTPGEDRLKAEVDRLRESARWRRWPDEKPEGSGRYLKLLRDRCEELTRFNLDEYCNVTKQWWGGNPVYWRPIGELPKTEAGGADCE